MPDDKQSQRVFSMLKQAFDLLESTATASIEKNMPYDAAILLYGFADRVGEIIQDAEMLDKNLKAIVEGKSMTLAARKTHKRDMRYLSDKSQKAVKIVRKIQDNRNTLVKRIR